MIYLDNAACTYPKPKEVYERLKQAFFIYGANPGRSCHAMAVKTDGAVFDVREKLCKMFGLSRAENVVFTPNTTYALNVALNALAKENTDIVTSVMEHNSVLRPLYKLQKERNCNIRFFTPDFEDKNKTVQSFENALGENCSCVVLTVCSNVNGYRFPIREIGEICKKRGVAFVVDGAQGAGYFDINMQKDNIDILCIPGHKGLFGICASGSLLISDSFEKKMSPIVYGGSGIMSKRHDMPDFLPEMLEAGTLATLPVITMGEGIDYINRHGIDRLYYNACSSAEICRQGLGNITGVNVYSCFGSMVVFNVQNIQCDTAAAMLSDSGFALRSGLHCAPLAHKLLGSYEQGSIRASFGCFNTPKDAHALVRAVSRIKNLKI